MEILDLVKDLHRRRRMIQDQKGALLEDVRGGRRPDNPETHHQWEQLDEEFAALGKREDELLTDLETQKALEQSREPFNDVVRGGPSMEQIEPTNDPSRHPPLLVSEANLRSHADAIRRGSASGTIEEHANVTVATDYGSPGNWGAGSFREPATLRAFAGITRAELSGATAQMPSLTLPAGSAGVAESTAHGEFDATDVANLSTLRYGRWTQVTSFVDEFTSLSAINQAHAVGIARDLNLVDITAIQTAAGTVTAFDATNLDRNVRVAILKVAAAVVGDPSEVVLFGTSAAMGVVTGYTPASGDDRGSVSTRVYGARVCVTESATAGNVYAFHPSAFQVFSSRLASATQIDPTNGMNKFGQWLHSTGPGLFIVGGAAGVDVVTP